MSSNEIPVEQARKVLGDLVIKAMRGQTTILTRYGKPIAQITPYTPEPPVPVTLAETTEIFEGAHGRAIDSYDLLDEMVDRYGLDRRDAHEAVLSFLADLGDDAVLERTPTRPELLESNPARVDVTYWLTIDGETATAIREAFAAVYA